MKEDVRLSDSASRLEDSPGARDALLLPAAQLRAPLPDVRLILLGEGADEPVGVRLLARRDELRVRGVGLAVQQVLPYGAREEHGLLGDQADLAAQPREVEGAQVPAVEEHLPAGRVVEAQAQADDRALPAAALAHERREFPSGDLEVYPAEDRVVGTRRVGELDPSELQLAPNLRRGRKMMIYESRSICALGRLGQYNL